MSDIIRLTTRLIKPRYEWKPRVNPNHPLSQGLVGCWLMNRPSVAREHNLLLPDKDITWYNTTPAITPFGRSRYFNGSNALGAISSLTIGSSVATLCFWLNVSTYNEAKILFELSTNVNSNAQCFCINTETTAGGCLAAGIRGNATDYRVEYVQAQSSWPNRLTFFCVVVDNSTTAGDIKIYVDGVERTTTITNNNKTGSGNFPTHPFYIMSRAGISHFKAGTLDNIRLYRRELTPAEVMWLYEEPFAGIDVPNFRDYWADEAPTFNPFWARNSNVLIQGAQL